MPELPEVETVRRGIEPYVVGRSIRQVCVHERRLRWPVPAELPKCLKGRTIVSVSRRAKILSLSLDNHDALLIHLGMSGRLRVLSDHQDRQKHDHLDIMLDDGSLLRYHDPRRFGAVLIWRRDTEAHVLLQNLGPEPFDQAFNGDYLFDKSRGRRASVKTFLMDGRVVVGAGNIYAAESLFRAGIRPGRAAGRVSRSQYQDLASCVRQVLSEAIEQGGTTLRDFAGAQGESGYFQQDLYVYGRMGAPCRVCTTPIRKTVLGQRSSFYCPSCQR